MPPVITFDCATCFRSLRVATEFAGRLIRCPVCRAMTLVPGECQEQPVLSDDDPTTPLRKNARRSVDG